MAYTIRHKNIFFQIARNCPVSGIWKFSRLSKEYRNYCNDEYLWKTLVERDMPIDEIEAFRKEIGNNYQELYKRYHLLKILGKKLGRKEKPSNIKKLKELYLYNNQLKELPKEIGLLQNLELLDLSNNQLKELPKEICLLQNLKELYLYKNQLKELSKEIGLLQNLELLDLSNNQLTDLPKEIGQLQKLKRLYFDDNQLREIPKELGQLKELKRLFLSRIN